MKTNCLRIKKIIKITPNNVITIVRAIPFTCKELEKIITNIKFRNGTTFWRAISECQQLSEQFIEKYKDKVNWYDISRYQKLPEPFIEKHKDKVDWCEISWCQQLSEQFIEKYKDKVN